MKRKGQLGTIWITILILTIIGLIATQVVWQLLQDKQSSTTQTDIQFTAVNNTCVRITDKCFLTGALVQNATAPDTDYLTDSFLECSDLGHYYGLKLVVENASTEYDGATMNATFTEVDCSQLSGMTALIVNYIPLMLAVVLLIAVAVFIR